MHLHWTQENKPLQSMKWHWGIHFPWRIGHFSSAWGSSPTPTHLLFKVIQYLISAFVLIFSLKRENEHQQHRGTSNAYCNKNDMVAKNQELFGKWKKYNAHIVSQCPNFHIYSWRCKIFPINLLKLHEI